MPFRPDRITGIGLIIGAVVSSQFGAALAATVFPQVGPLAVVALRLATSAALLVVAGRGVHLPSTGLRDWAAPIAMGVVLAVMNSSIYAAIARLPLGVVITLEFLGPLAVVLLHSRRRTDLGLALAALGGVALLTGGLGAGLGGDDDLAGVVFTLVAAVGWACYIVLNREFGRRAADGGLALASIVAVTLVVPVAASTAARAHWAGWTPKVLAIGLAVGILSSALPYTTDRIALRRIEPGTFAVLMSLHPAVAALAGLALLGQTLTVEQFAGMALVAAVSALAVRISAPSAP
jgi:inner membrane transporter RhtA